MSQCARVLAVLADGLPHDIAEIHDRAGTMRLNSRVAELRTRGHQIVCTRTGDTYSYRLLASLGEPRPEEAPTAGLPDDAATAESAASLGSPSEAEDSSSPPEELASLGSPAQLALEVVA